MIHPGTPLILACGLVSAVLPLAAADWVAPAEASAVTNPLAASSEVIEAGRAVYVQFCVHCHGATGAGDGPGAALLKPRPSALGDPQVLKQSDGALFWKLTTGRGAMTSWANILTEPQRWKVVHYLRSLTPKP